MRRISASMLSLTLAPGSPSSPGKPMAPGSPCERNAQDLLKQVTTDKNWGFCNQGWCYSWAGGIIIRLKVNIEHKEANKHQSCMKASKWNSAGAKIWHIVLAPLDILGQVLIQPFMCQYEDNPKRTILQPECIILHDLWHTLSHLGAYRWDRKKRKKLHLTVTIRLAFSTKNREPFLVLQQVMSSIYLILFKLPWRNAITLNRGATGADIDGLCR